jgi:hypothetical protein
LFRSRTSVLTASATEEVGTSTITSMPSRSSHWRATVEPTSGRFWWSACTTSTLIPRWVMPLSWIASRTAWVEPGPDRSR